MHLLNVLHAATSSRNMEVIWRLHGLWRLYGGYNPLTINHNYGECGHVQWPRCIDTNYLFAQCVEQSHGSYEIILVRGGDIVHFL